MRCPFIVYCVYNIWVSMDCCLVGVHGDVLALKVLERFGVIKWTRFGGRSSSDTFRRDKNWTLLCEGQHWTRYGEMDTFWRIGHVWGDGHV